MTGSSEGLDFEHAHQRDRDDDAEDDVQHSGHGPVLPPVASGQSYWITSADDPPPALTYAQVRAMIDKANDVQVTDPRLVTGNALTLLAMHDEIQRINADILRTTLYGWRTHDKYGVLFVGPGGADNSVLYAHDQETALAELLTAKPYTLIDNDGHTIAQHHRPPSGRGLMGPLPAALV